MAMLKIGTKNMPNPASYIVHIRDGDSENTKRDETWYMHRERVRSNMYAIDVTWEVSGADYRTVVTAMRDAKLPIEFFNPEEASYVSFENFYRGDVTCTLIEYLDEGRPENSAWEISTTLTCY